MIEDLEGSTSEPSRRFHLVALSAATAAISLAVLVALVVPMSDVAAPETATPGASPGAFSLTYVSPVTASFILAPNRIDLAQLSSPRDLWMPCSVRVEPSTGRDHLVTPDARTSRLSPLVAFGPRTTWLTVSCVTSDSLVPWESIAR